MDKNYHPVRKFFGKLVCNRHVDHLEKHGLFPDYEYPFTFFQSIADLLTVASYEVARAFYGSGSTQAAVFDILKAFERGWHVGLLYKRKSYLVFSSPLN